MSDPAFVGIDLSFAKNKPIPIVVCVQDGRRLLPLPLREMREPLPPRGRGNPKTIQREAVRGFVREVREYLEALKDAEGLSIERVAIDAPSDYRSDGLSRRRAEVAMDRAGITCFTTPSEEEFQRIRRKVRTHLRRGGAVNRLPHANQLWMLAGFELFRGLENVVECRETFPQAVVRALGVADRHKSKTGAALAQLKAAAEYTGWPIGQSSAPSVEDISFGPLHDKIDAYLCAWVASLRREETIAYGEPPDDVIWCPRLDSDGRFRAEMEAKGVEESPGPFEDDNVMDEVVTDPERHPLHRLVHRRVLCPACRDKVFARWPLGWDAHAAYKCTGLGESGEAERKREFKHRFSSLFLSSRPD